MSVLSANEQRLECELLDLIEYNVFKSMSTRVFAGTKNHKYQCHHCKRLLSNPREFKGHECVKIFKCHSCFQTFPTQDLLNLHIVSSSYCPTCEACFPDFPSNKHPHHCVKYDRPHYCCVCGLSFATEKAMFNHLTQHIDGSRNSRCFVPITDMDILNTGQRASCGLAVQRSGRIKYECVDCNACFSNVNVLISHILEHVGEVSHHKCMYCSDTFEE